MNIVPTKATRQIAQTMIRRAKKDTGADAALAHLRDVHPDQVPALIAILLTSAKLADKPGRPPIPPQMSEDERKRAYAAYKRGDDSTWAVEGYREYQRVNQQNLRERKKKRATESALKVAG